MKNSDSKSRFIRGPGISSIFKKADIETVSLVVLSTFLLTIWVYYGKQEAFYKFFSSFVPGKDADFFATIYEYVSAFVLMFVIPLILVRFTSRKGVKDFGMQMGDVRYGLRFVLLAIPVVIFVAYIGSLDQTMQQEYPLAKSVIGHTNKFLIIEFFYLIYYVGWEFLFRGAMLFSVERVYGPVAAILVQLIPSALVHIGKPASESFGAIIGGLIFGFLAIRTRSFIYPLILHACLGIGTDIFTILQR